ncbi:MAG: CRISPR-associated endonuclease/helicase Cas3 [Dehalococcoidia bacterium]|nr:CRISPR-associated endonuclease/helicase Cas3 [Bacillota bacterium]
MLDPQAIFLLWGKKKGEPPHESRHPLLFHMLDVAFVLQALWEHSLQSGIKQRLSDELGLLEADAIACLSFWASLHDIGKASPVFQKKSELAMSELKKLEFSFDRHAGETYHACITTKVIRNMSNGFDAPREFIDAMSTALGGHHGIFPTSTNIRNISYRALGDSDGLWTDARTALVRTLKELISQGRPLCPGRLPSNWFFIIFAALTSVADWIGSNDTYFPHEPNLFSLEDYARQSQLRAKDALEKLGWINLQRATSITGFYQLFPEITALRPLQEEVISLTGLKRQPSMVLIEAPMGEGKTEAALYLAHHWLRENSNQGYYVALPTQATSNQMFGRVKKALQRQYPHIRTNFQLIHGASRLNEEFQQLRLASMGDERGEGIVAEEWFLNRKRSLLAAFGVGTIDQALISVLQTRHFFVRLLGLCNKTVIIDEVHAYDTYMSTLLERMLRWLAVLGSPVILLSATLPAERRHALFAAYCGGKQLSLPEQAYPRITCLGNGETWGNAFAASRPYVLQLRRMDDAMDNVVNIVRKAISDGGYIAVICNTVGRAQETYTTLKEAAFLGEGEVQLLHARYPYAEREWREKLVLDTFGKDGPRSGKAVLVSTQIIEQSLDIDFDLMITDLAPADLVIQRAGRLHRHQHHKRPSNMAEPVLWVRMPETNSDGIPDFKGAGYVYDKYVLLRSYLLLRECDTIVIPQDIESIIEETYADSSPSWPSKEMEQSAIDLKQETAKQQDSACREAKSNLVAMPDTGETPSGYLGKFSKELEEDDPELHQSLQALTRLTGPSVRVVCLHACEDGCLLNPEDPGSRIDIDGEPQEQDIKNLLRQSLTITQKGLLHEIIRSDDCHTPNQWKKVAPLRHHRRLVFENRQCQVGSYLLTLDDELGLRAEKTQGERR